MKSAFSLVKGLRGLPVQPFEVLKMAKSYVGMREESLRLGLFVDPRLDDDFLDGLIQLFKPAEERARVFVHVLSEGLSLGGQVSYDALVLIVQRPDLAQALVRQAGELGLPVLVVVQEGLRRDAAQAYEMSILDVASARGMERLSGQIAVWFAENLKDHRIALAADFVFMRPTLANAVIMATARQNAIIAFVVLIPGADMPVLTLNQVKMALQVAVIYGEDISWERAAEIVVVVGSAFATRALARLLTKRFRLMAWPLKSAIAFGSTVALGKALELRLVSFPQGSVPLCLPERSA